MKKVYVLGLFFLLFGCKNTDTPVVINKITVTSASEFKYGIIGSDDAPVLALTGSILSESSLKESFLAKKFDYARLDCYKNGQYKPYAYISVKEEEKVGGKFKSSILLKICPENDANSQYCINSIEDLKNKINTNLKCEAFFGGMTKSKIVVSYPFEININNLRRADNNF